MDAILFGTLDRMVKKGSLQLTTARGKTKMFGDGSGPPVVARFACKAAQRRVLADPELRLGEAYADGQLSIENGSVADLLNLLLSQGDALQSRFTSRLLSGTRLALRRINQHNLRKRSKRNVAHHYDLDGRLYDLFLDRDRQYSCAYFEDPNLTLDEAQTAKKRHVAAKLLVEPSASVLDIGCGWGGLSLFLAETYGAQVTGITLSEEQHGYARQRAAIAPHGDQVNFQLCDYREVEGRFDRIVSVGMFEHVGVSHFGTFFRKCHDLLTDDGVLLLHSIGRCDRPGFTNPWIAKYIFPGGYIPSLSEVLPAVESSGLVVTDIEILRLHYAETLRHWRERFLARRDEAVDLYDERFARLWEFYLAVSEMAFRHQGMMVFQMQIAKRQASVPLRRDYIGAEEARLRNVNSDAEDRTSAL
ncbi:cyclopropane-fatty-acyl-phospholipid synthase family protein [Pelagibacterium flavum]|uniref:Cyclopropane-fatty-acyl-phospholipid synthase family protein n=2 Tax=Pelagibacterium flavum TaxID=2984530 RepID=A0ABY6IS41_9HYPH|nr:cyclopropane-fatty-acyl-phospholipid synthase family protein [Pelagibacterium sp. YIM 151497]